MSIYEMQDRYRDADMKQSSSSGCCFSTYSAKGVLVAVPLTMIAMTALAIAGYGSNELPLQALVLQRPARPSGWKGSKLLERRLRSSRCQQTCGSLEIPYPFGLSPDCSLSKFFQLECNFKQGVNVSSASYEMGYWPFLTNIVTGSASGWQYNTTSKTSFPYKFYARSFQVLNFTAGSFIVIETSAIKAMSCGPEYNATSPGNASILLPHDGPYRITDGNILAAVGCSSKASYKAFPDPTNGITARCGPNSCANQYIFNYCNDYDCCVTPIEFALGVHIKGEGTAFADSSTCGYGTILNPPSYATASTSLFGSGVYGTELVWYVPIKLSRQNNTAACDVVDKASQDYACAASDQNVCISLDVQSPALDAGNSSGVGYICHCAGGYMGDGYKNGTPCTDIDECLDESQNQCDLKHAARCINLPGSYNCSCPRGTYGDGFKDGTGCTRTGLCGI